MTADRKSSAGRLVAVVVTHDRLEKLRETLARLLEVGPEGLQAVVVVDNASTDGTGDWLQVQDDPRVAVVTSAENLGGAGGFDKGMRHAVQMFDPDWLVVMDDDARPDPDALAVFHAHPRRDDTAWAAAVYYPDGRICDMNRPSINPFWSPVHFLRALVLGRDGYHIPHSAYDAKAPTSIDLTSFVGLFLSRRIIGQTGYPDPGLFLYGDDVIYTLTLRRQGLRILFDPDLRFEHDFGSFGGQDRGPIRPLWKVYYFLRNRLLMYRAAAGWAFWFLLPVMALKWEFAARRYGADQATYLRLKRRAVRDAVRRKTCLSHRQVLALSQDTVSRSEYPGDSAPAGSDPSAGSPG